MIKIIKFELLIVTVKYVISKYSVVVFNRRLQI